MEKVNKANNLLGLLIVLGCSLLTLQIFAIPLASSRYDLTCFIILFATIFFQKEKKEFNFLIIVFFLLFITLELFKYLFFQYSPTNRLISGIVWLGGLFLIFLKRDFISYNQATVHKSFIFGFVVTSLWFFKQFVFGMDTGEFSNLIFRPKGFFDEPSYAGLFLYSVAAGSFAILVLLDNSKKEFLIYSIVFVMSFCLGFTTFSMHIVTFSVGLLFTILVYLIISDNALFKLGIGTLFIIMFTVGIYYILSLEHFVERLQLVGSMNLSVVSWMQGLHQAFTSFFSSPLFGFGLGATGGFEFVSDTHYKLELLNKVGQNRFDGYSMAYRLVIEIGFVFFLFIIYQIVKEAILFVKTLQLNVTNSSLKYYVFNFIFALSLIIGILIKEPTYARSYVYVSILIYFTARIIYLKTISRA